MLKRLENYGEISLFGIVETGVPFCRLLPEDTYLCYLRATYVLKFPSDPANVEPLLSENSTKSAFSSVITIVFSMSFLTQAASSKASFSVFVAIIRIFVMVKVATT